MVVKIVMCTVRLLSILVDHGDKARRTRRVARFGKHPNLLPGHITAVFDLVRVLIVAVFLRRTVRLVEVSSADC